VSDKYVTWAQAATGIGSTILGIIALNWYFYESAEKSWEMHYEMLSERIMVLEKRTDNRLATVEKNLTESDRYLAKRIEQMGVTFVKALSRAGIYQQRSIDPHGSGHIPE